NSDIGPLVGRVQSREDTAAAINAAVERARGAILVFTDARQELATDAVTHLVLALSDPAVGAASGELTHRDAATGAARSIGIYWQYERFIRTQESAFFSCVGASGALYAMRRSDFEPLRPGTILDDFESPMATVRRHKRIVLESRAIVIDDLEVDLAGERKRKVRTLAGNFQSFSHNRWLFSPRENPIWWQFLSHKVGRLVVPYALVGALFSAWALPGLMYRAFALAQTGFYLVALAALASATVRRSKLASAAGLFLDTNVAAIEALWRFVRGDLAQVWVPTTKQAPLE
ncbi:MAG TPA: glycosyltransferase, partial [Pseudomonadales bacterium]